MKTIALKPLTLAVVIAFALLVVAGLTAMNERASAKDRLHEKTVLQSQTYEYDELKRRWSVKESQTVYAYLKAHPNLTKEEKRGKNITMQFDHLSSLEFNRLSNKILNSMLMIKKLSLKRQGNSQGSIFVEFES